MIKRKKSKDKEQAWEGNEAGLRALVQEVKDHMKWQKNAALPASHAENNDPPPCRLNLQVLVVVPEPFRS